MAKKIVIDANLLLLWLAGHADLAIIRSHRRLQRFEIRHFHSLSEMVAPYRTFVVTPHILAELWNLIGEDRGTRDARRARLLETAKGLVGLAIEIYDPAVELTTRPEISWLGLADVSQLVAASRGFDLISADGPLCHEAMRLGIHALHFWQKTDEKG